MNSFYPVGGTLWKLNHCHPMAGQTWVKEKDHLFGCTTAIDHRMSDTVFSTFIGHCHWNPNICCMFKPLSKILIV